MSIANQIKNISSAKDRLQAMFRTKKLVNK